MSNGADLAAAAAERAETAEISPPKATPRPKKRRRRCATLEPVKLELEEEKKQKDEENEEDDMIDYCALFEVSDDDEDTEGTLAVKAEDAMSAGSGSSKPGTRRQKAKLPCPGCHRRYGIDLEFRQARTITATTTDRSQSLVNWAFPKGRGRWCRRCFNCWRSILRNKFTLSQLEVLRTRKPPR